MRCEWSVGLGVCTGTVGSRDTLRVVRGVKAVDLKY